MKVLIAVTHLLGTGHLARALILARAFAQAGHSVRVVSGGMPATHLSTDGIAFSQLPPLRSDGVNFTRLLDEKGADASDTLHAARQRRMVDTVADMQPDVVITELFPFGRRVLRNEFIALITAARQLQRPALVCASIRDILAPPSKPAKAQAAEALIATCYDAVLVHSHAAVTPLDASWPVAPALAAKLHYTGFVAQPPASPHPDALGTGQVVVSAGGGSVGAPLYRAALAAARLQPDTFWHLLVGGADAPQRCASLRTSAPPNALIEPARPDFRQMLYHAAASVSMCGYNTALDVLQAGTAAVFVPFDDGGEVEQSLRAKALSKLDGIEIVTAAELSGTALLGAVKSATAAPQRTPRHDGLDGAAKTVRVVSDLLENVSHGG